MSADERSSCSSFHEALVERRRSADLPGPVLKDDPPVGLLLDVTVIVVGVIRPE